MWRGTCSVKQGFFVLRDCLGPALSACNFCSRPVCQEHGLQRGQNFICFDCQARQQQMTEPEQIDQMTQDGTESRSGLYTYRHGYYLNHGYSPFYGGLYYDRYYDTYDTRAFAKREVPGFDDDDQISQGFGDS